MKERRKQTALQKACLLKGQLLWQISSTTGLVKFLRERGYAGAAKELENLVHLARYDASQVAAEAVYQARKAKIAAENAKE